jgi:hypothetical protein
MSAVNPQLKQFATDCNTDPNKDLSKTAKDPVVEHKGSVRQGLALGI